MNRLNNNLQRLQRNKQMIAGAQRYINGLAHAQSKPFIQRGMGNLGFSLEVAGYDLADTDTYKDAYKRAGDEIDGAWEWLEDATEYIGEGVVDVWDRLGEQISLMKDGFTSMLDIAYVTADGVAELWALYKWVGGPSEMLEIKRKRDNWLIRKKKNTFKYGPFYMRANEDGSKPVEMPSDATNDSFITEEQARRLPEDHPDFLGTHTIIGLPQATWKYYLGGFDGITPDWRNPLHYPNAVLYWYYDAQIEKIEAISADFDKSSLGRSRDWLFERGTLLKAWMAGGWEELFNMKQLIDQNYRVAKAKTELLGHEAAAEVQGAMLMTPDGDTEEADPIEVLGIKSSKQVVMDKMEKLRKMFPYNAKAYMGPQMWFTMHDFRQKKKNKETTPYPLIMLEDKISENEMSSLMKYLEQSRDEKLAESIEAFDNGIPGAYDEGIAVRDEYNAAVGAVNNMPMIFVEGMMSAFGGRAGPFYTLDADMQFGDFVWSNSDAFATNKKPEKPAGIRPFWRDITQNSAFGSEIENSWQTGPIGNTIINREAWANAQPAFSVRGWGYGTQIFTPADPATGDFGYANLGHFFDWHPFNALWCHDGETHMAGQYSFLHNSRLDSQDTADYSVLQTELDGAYMSDYWAWNESLRFKPLYLLRNGSEAAGGAFTYTTQDFTTINDNKRRQIELRDVDFLVRRNKAITDFANSGITLNQAISSPELPPIANMRMTSDASIITKNEVAAGMNGGNLEGSTSGAAANMATGVFGATSPKASGLYSLNYSPVQSIFAVGYTNNGVRSIWSATAGKGLKYGPAIGHGKKVRRSRYRNRSAIGGSKYVAGITNYHTVTAIGYNPYAVTADRNYGTRAGIEGSYAQRTYLFGLGAGQSNSATGQYQWITNTFFDNENYQRVDRNGEDYLPPIPASYAPSIPVSARVIPDLEPPKGVLGVMPTWAQRSINWFTIGGPFIGGMQRAGGAAAEMSMPGFGYNAKISHIESQHLLLAGITPPIETVSQTGLTPRPGIYSSNLQSGSSYPFRGAVKPGFGRFPGSNETNFVALNNITGSQKGMKHAGYDYVDPLFSSVLTLSKDVVNGNMGGSDWTTHSYANPIRKRVYFGQIEQMNVSQDYNSVGRPTSIFDAPNLHLMTTKMPPAKADGSIGQIFSGSSGLFGSVFSGVDKLDSDNDFPAMNSFLAGYPEHMTASANFNYARMKTAHLTRLATALRNSWDRNPAGHGLLSIAITVVLDGEKLTKAELSQATFASDSAVDGKNTFGFKIGSGTLSYQDLNPQQIMNNPKPWTVNEIRDALNSQWLEGSSQKLIESIVLAEPDSNPLGVWFETMHSDHEFFGITDMEKLKENAELILDGEQLKLMNESELWNFHRALANKDKNGVSPDVVDWFNSKVTKYGWCHVMQGAMPVRLDKMKQPAKMPRYWAPLFVPFRPIAEFAPRVYVGTSLDEKKLYNSEDSQTIGPIEYFRRELTGIAPHIAENDDIRLHDSVRLVARSITNADWDEAQSDLDGNGSHWATQYSWLNCGWFGFDSVAEAQMFMKLQFDTTTVSFDEASYNWKGMLNGPPTGMIGFGPIDDLINFVRYFDSMIMSKIDVERAYLSALRRYESMKIRFDKMAQFRIDLVDASLNDLTSGLAKVVQTGNVKPKTYRWLPVFAYDDNGVAKLHPDNAEAIFVMMESQPNASLSAIQGANWSAAATSPSKFVAGCIIEQQIDNDLSEGADWDFVEYIATQGRSDNEETLIGALSASGFPNASSDALVPWFVGGKAVRKKVDVVGGVFKDWEKILTSDSSPMGRFLNKMRGYNMNIEKLWNNKLPGFSMSMKEFWAMLGEDNTVISDFIADVVDLFKNARADYGQVASSVVNINDKIETYLDNFEKMSINWSNSIEAMNKYADYMAKNLFSLNEKFEFALEKFQAPYQTFQDVITSEESPLQFDELVAKLDRVFNKNDKMTSTLANKMAFGTFKDQGAKARMSAKDIIASINGSGLAQIDVSNSQSRISQAEDMIKPWLELPPPPHIDLNIRAPRVRPWVSDDVDLEIEGGWSNPEFNENDLPSKRKPDVKPPRIDIDLLDPRIRMPGGNMLDPKVRDFYQQNYTQIENARVRNPGSSPFDRNKGYPIYSTFPAGKRGKTTGVGPNGEVFNTYFGPEPPESAQIGDKWLDGSRMFEWNGEIWVLERQLELIDDVNGGVAIDRIDIDNAQRPGLDLTELVSGGQKALRPDDVIIKTEAGNENGGTSSNNNTNANTNAGNAAVNQAGANTGMRVGPMAGVLRGPLSYRR